MPASIMSYTASDYLVTEEVAYVDVHNLFPLYEKLAFAIDLILVGETGIAKSASVASFAKKLQVPLITHWCSEDQRREHLVGHLTLEDTQTVYHLGPLPKAVELANKAGKCILLFEELNGLTQQSQKLLNSLTDWHRNVETDYGTYKLNKDAKLWIVGTMNTSAYGGVFSLNTDLKSRFRILPLGYASKDKEKEIVNTLVKGLDPKVVDKVLTLAQTTRQGTVDYALSPRDVVDILRDSKIVGIGEAIRLQSGKFEGAERATFIAWVKQTFTDDMLKTKKPLA